MAYGLFHNFFRLLGMNGIGIGVFQYGAAFELNIQLNAVDKSGNQAGQNQTKGNGKIDKSVFIKSYHCSALLAPNNCGNCKAL